LGIGQNQNLNSSFDFIESRIFPYFFATYFLGNFYLSANLVAFEFLSIRKILF